jgi:hypothetical protein
MEQESEENGKELNSERVKLKLKLKFKSPSKKKMKPLSNSQAQLNHPELKPLNSHHHYLPTQP